MAENFSLSYGVVLEKKNRADCYLGQHALVKSLVVEVLPIFISAENIVKTWGHTIPGLNVSAAGSGMKLDGKHVRLTESLVGTSIS
jgi:hypothetical protein